MSNNRKSRELHNVYAVFSLEVKLLFCVDETFDSSPVMVLGIATTKLKDDITVAGEGRSE